MKSILEFARARREERPVVVVAAYDALMARLLAASEADAILVGDSVAMVVHGHPDTVHATPEMMALHTAAVRRGAPDAVIITDMPFLSVRSGRSQAVLVAGEQMRAGATAVKIEGVAGHEDIIAHLVGSGIPVMGHLGLTPQSIHQLGGHRVQARSVDGALRLRHEAKLLEKLGAFAVVLECVPAALAAEVTRDLDIPTIGIGAGPDTAGQVLVLSDLLGMDASFRPAFARRYFDGAETVVAAINAFVRDVRGAKFPAGREIIA